MDISIYLFPQTSENPQSFSVKCILAKLIANPLNYS